MRLDLRVESSQTSERNLGVRKNETSKLMKSLENSEFTTVNEHQWLEITKYHQFSDQIKAKRHKIE